MISCTSFYQHFMSAVPEFRAIHDEHVSDYDELLEHVLMGDLTRFVQKLFTEDPESECLNRTLSFLARSFLADDEALRELISVSFLENIAKNDVVAVGIKHLLSPELNDELNKY